MPDLLGLPAELVEWHRQFAEKQRQAARQLRTLTCRCRRCGGSFTFEHRGVWFRAQGPYICPDCQARRQREYLRAWRERKRAERSQAIHSRSCNGCGEPIPEGRVDRRYCSPACRQRAYRQRRA